MENLKVFLTS